MSLVFPHTFVPWFRAVAPYVHAYRARPSSSRIAGELIAAGKLNLFVAGHGDPARDGHQARRSCTASGRRSTSSSRQAAQASRIQPRPGASPIAGGTRLRAGGRRPVALRDRGRVLAELAEHADGQCDGARRVGQLPHPRGRWASSTGWTSMQSGAGAQGRLPRPSARRSTSGDWCCSSPFGFAPPARPSTCRWRTWRRARRSRCRPTSCSS